MCRKTGAKIKRLDPAGWVKARMPLAEDQDQPEFIEGRCPGRIE